MVDKRMTTSEINQLLAILKKYRTNKEPIFINPELLPEPNKIEHFKFVAKRGVEGLIITTKDYPLANRDINLVNVFRLDEFIKSIPVHGSLFQNALDLNNYLLVGNDKKQVCLTL